MSFVAVRGAAPLKDETELRAQLATLLRLENVGLFLGAGASVAAGGKTMVSLWRDFCETSPAEARWLSDNDFVAEESVSNPQVSPPLEALLDSIEIALIEWRRQQLAGVHQLTAARAQLTRALVRAAQLDESWWNAPSVAELDGDRLASHRTVLQKLTAARQPGQAAPWLFTTNYDLAIEWAAESIDLHVIDGFLGIHGRRFSPQSFDLGFRNTQARGEARFGVYNIYLAKLHGSLSWREQQDQIYEIQASLAGRYINEFLSNDRSSELGLLVLPRAAKYVQTSGFVLGELFRRFSEFLARPQATLIVCGYGFGDPHVNRILRSALLNPTLQLVIYFPSFNGEMLSEELPHSLRKLLSLKNPRVTVVGGGEAAYLERLALQLPDPLLFDEDMRKLEKVLRDAREAPASPHLQTEPL